MRGFDAAQVARVSVEMGLSGRGAGMIDRDRRDRTLTLAQLSSYYTKTHDEGSFTCVSQYLEET